MCVGRRKLRRGAQFKQIEKTSAARLLFPCASFYYHRAFLPCLFPDVLAESAQINTIPNYRNSIDSADTDAGGNVCAIRSPFASGAVAGMTVSR